MRVERSASKTNCFFLSGVVATSASTSGAACRSGLPRATQGLVLTADLATNLTLPEADWVLCLEVAEHVPPEFESTFLSNLNRHARKGVVLSWSSERRGLGHRNPQSEAYAIGRMQSLGFAFDSSKSEALRHSASRKGWFRKTLMVFRRERAGRSKT